MPKLEDSLIDRLTLRPEVREKARALLRTVHSKTGPGTGYDIRDAKTGLPAICAYIASKSAGYADITQEIAQKASCLAPKTFAIALKTVKTALLASKTPPTGSPSKQLDEIDPTAYSTLIREHEIGQPLRVESWMKKAQAALIALPRFRHDFASRLTESSAEVRIVVFFWVCRTIKLSTVQYMPLVDKFGVSLKVFSRLVNMMEDDCVDLKESIRARVKEMRKEKKAKTTTKEVERPTSKTPASTPSQSRSASPTKSALRSATTQTPSSITSKTTTPLKRKVAFSLTEVSASEDDDGVFAPPETPSKRPRTTPRRSSSAARIIPVPVPMRNAESTSSEEAEAEDIEMSPGVPAPCLVASEPVAGPSTPRRLRPAATPTHAYRTPPSARIQMFSLLSAEDGDDGVEDVATATVGDDAEAEASDDDALPPSRRFRPVFVDRAQWAQRAPRLARDRAIAERRTKELVERWGHPFELLRHATAGAAAG